MLNINVLYRIGYISLFSGLFSFKRFHSYPILDSVRNIYTKLDVQMNIPEYYHKYFKYGSYIELYPASLLEYTDGKCGHLFNDTLASKDDFKFRMFMNLSCQTSDNSPDEKYEGVMPKEDLYKLLSTHDVRRQKTQLITLVDVGKHCCGHINIWHGGVISAVFDNILGFLGNIIFPVAATRTLNVKFNKPIFVGETILFVTEYDPTSNDDFKRFTAYSNAYNKNGDITANAESELVDVSEKWKNKN